MIDLLLRACIAKIATEVKCLCSTSKKCHRFCVCSDLTIIFCLHARRNKQCKIAFRTSRVEDTHLTLAAILF